MEKSLFIRIPYDQPKRAAELLNGLSTFRTDVVKGLSVFINNIPPRRRIIVAASYSGNEVLKWLLSLTGVTIDFTDMMEKLVGETEKGQYNAHIGNATARSIEMLHFEYIKGERR